MKKKVLFPILALVLVLALAIPMAIPVAASPATVLLTPSWNKTTGTEVNPTAGGLGTATKPWDDMTPWVSWTAVVWNGTDPSLVSGRTIPNFESDWTWMHWIHVTPDWTQHTDRWLHTQVSIPASWVVQAVQLVHVRNSTPTVLYDIPINDDLYVYVDQTYVAGGGTAAANIAGGSEVDVDALLGYPTPPDPDGDDSEGWPDPYFKAAVGFGRPGDLPEVDWDIPGGLGLPPEFFTPGIHDIHVLVEEFRDSGGIGHLGFEIEYDIVSIDITKEADSTSVNEGDTISYNYSVHNDGDVSLGPPTVTDSLGILVSPVLDGHPFNIGDTNDDNVFDPCETWNFTANYTVPWFYDCSTVENTANASAWYDVDVFEVTDESDLVVVDIVRNPDIELTKTGPEGGYFQTLNADYFYSLNNTGDCSLNVTLAIDARFLDDVPGGYVGYVNLTYTGGDDGNGYLDPDEVWNYTSEWLLECDPEVEQDRTHFIDIGYVEAEDAKGNVVYACDCWTVIIFQWLPRTIGYWGNWDNHYTEVQFEALLEAAIDNSPNIEDLDDDNWYGEGDVHDFLLGKPPFKKKDRGKDAFAKFIMEKQFLATWFNVKSYMDWVEDEPIPDFIGTADAAMNPDATVYLTAECMPDGAAGLFEADTLSVEELLTFIEAEKTEWHAAEFGIAYEVLDIMNNAESNNYCAFIDPDWDPGECPVLI